MRVSRFFLPFVTFGLACAAQENGLPPNSSQTAGHGQPASVQLTRTTPVTISVFSVSGQKQPPGLRLTLTLPKTRYYVGEVISAKLAFSNDSKVPYHLWIGAYDRSGRILDIGFRAEGEDGLPLPDPLEWYFQHFLGVCGGIGNDKNLGTWEISLRANQWVKFEKPGKYKLSAWSSRVQPGDVDVPYEKQLPAVQLVSDPVTITVDPLSAEEEKAVIQRAQQDLSKPHKPGSNEAAVEAVERLRFLQTPASCDALLPFIDSPYGSEAMLGLCEWPDYGALTRKILAAVREGKLGLSDNLLSLYVSMKMGANMIRIDPPDARPAALRDELKNAARDATEEDGAGDVFFDNLLTLFRGDPKEPKIRAIMIKRQLDLPQKQIDEFLKENASLVDTDFLPLVREQVKPDKHNPYALAALAAIAPDEARPIVIADIKRSHAIYIPTDHVFRPDMDFFALEALPDREMPVLDPILREKLPRQPYDQDSLEATMVLIERYATKALLPDVVGLYKVDEGNWQCVLQAAALRYWIRCDPASGVEALGRALKRDGEHDTGCFRDVITDVLQKAWVNEALPLVLAATRNKDLMVIRSAATLLEAHAGPEAIDTVIAAIEQIASRPLPVKGYERERLLYEPRGLTDLLIQSKRWKLTHPQLERLQKVAADENLKERLNSMLAATAK